MSFDIPELISRLNDDDKMQRIGLQFSSELQNGFQVDFYRKMRPLCPSKDIFIIGDTSYGSCCCDEITAEHLNADIIVRIGSSCFTRNRCLPCYFLYDNLPISNDQINECSYSLNDIIKQANDNTNDIIIFYSEKVKKNLISSIRKDAQFKDITFADINCWVDNQTNDGDYLYGRQINNFGFNNKTTMIYIGNDNDQILNELCLRFIAKIKAFYLIDLNNFKHTLINQATINTCLYRRFNLIEKAKQANTFGILIGSLSIRNLNDIIADIKSTLLLKGKKYYIFLLGKLTDEKLCNFTEYIDCFILIACPFNPSYNTKTCMKPIVSPLDIKIAFDPQFSWDSSYSFDANFIKHKLAIESQEKSNEMSILDSQKEINALELKSINEALAPIFSQTTLTTYDQRKFKGLEVEGEKSVKKVTKGKRGIPIKYEDII